MQAQTVNGASVQMLEDKLSWVADHSTISERARQGQPDRAHLDEPDAMTVQILKYAEDLARIYEEEKARSKALQETNERLQAEITAREAAEKELLRAKQELELRVAHRTRELSRANEKLEIEVKRRRIVEEHIKASLKEKEVLLGEIHHRVKNNLQIVSSLLALQGTFVNDQRIVQALEDCQSRVRSIALIHEQLYRSEDMASIDFSQYLANLINVIVQTHSEKMANTAMNIDVPKTLLDMRIAVPCSLIINELVTNSIKHAFPSGRTGEIRVGFHETARGRYELVVEDNGTGLSKGFDYRTTNSLGLQLVINLAELQLQGKLHVHSNGGTKFIVEFEDRAKA